MSVTTVAGAGPAGTENTTGAPKAGSPVESKAVSETPSCVWPAFTVSTFTIDKLDALIVTGTCGASGLLSGSAMPMMLGVMTPTAPMFTIALGPAHGEWNRIPTLDATVTVASAITAPRASRATARTGIESIAVVTTRSASTLV